MKTPISEVFALVASLALLSTGCGSVFDMSDEPLGKRYVERGQYEKAVSIFSGGIAKEPSASLYLCRGVAYEKLRDYPAAIADAKASIALEDGWRARCLLGILRMETGDWQSAIENFDKALEKNPSEEKLRTLRAEAVRRKAQN